MMLKLQLGMPDVDAMAHIPAARPQPRHYHAPAQWLKENGNAAVPRKLAMGRGSEKR